MKKNIHDQHEEGTEEYLKRLNEMYEKLPTHNSKSQPPSKEDIEYIKQIIKRGGK